MIIILFRYLDDYTGILAENAFTHQGPVLLQR